MKLAFKIMMILAALSMLDTARARLAYLECMDTAECSFGTCCAVGEGRFSIPMCRAELRLGDRCRPLNNKPQNITLQYPDGATVNFTNIYRILCPCEPHLYCSQETGTCQDYVEATKYNEIENIY